jgi:protein AroM
MRRIVPKIGFATIGQSPRADIIPELASVVGFPFKAFEGGALDDLTPEKISALKPAPKEFPLITRLADGSSVVVGKERIFPRLQKTIGNLEKQDVDFIALLCTEDFPGLASRKIILRPSKILFSLASSILSTGKMGILVPLEEQKAKALKKWKRRGIELVIEAFNPYLLSPGSRQTLERMKTALVDLVVCDCLGFSLIMKEEIQDWMGKPVIVPRSVLAKVIGELLA